MTIQEAKEIRERIRRDLADYEPGVRDVDVNVIADEETGEDSTIVDLTLTDPPTGQDSWDLDRLDELAAKVEQIIAERDLPAAVISMQPLSREEFEDDSSGD
jgi:hypothetical protein